MQQLVKLGVVISDANEYATSTIAGDSDVFYDGIIWYFDLFDMSSYNFYLTLLQFKYAGWFRYCKGVLIGRPAFPKVEDKKLDYIKAADKALGKIPHIMEMDIGHTFPNFTLINGALCKVRYKDGKGDIAFILK